MQTDVATDVTWFDEAAATNKATPTAVLRAGPNKRLYDVVDLTGKLGE